MEYIKYSIELLWIKAYTFYKPLFIVIQYVIVHQDSYYFWAREI